MKRCIQVIVICLVLVIGGFLAFIYSGSYDVSAASRTSGFIEWLAGTVRRNSIDSAAAGIQVPSLSDPAMIRDGAHHYAEMCANCHLAPGIGQSEIREGLNPRPPRLAKIAGHIPDAKLYWVIKNGIRMTGMPAWGPSHSDAKIWSIVAFVKQLPAMSPAEYDALTKPRPPAASTQPAAPGEAVSQPPGGR